MCAPFDSVKNEPLVPPGDRLGHDFAAVGSRHTDTCAPCGSVKSGALAQLYGGAREEQLRGRWMLAQKLANPVRQCQE